MKLKQYISKHKVTVNELAQAVGCSQPAMSLYKNGHRKPRPEIALRIVRATDGKVTLEDLYAAPTEKAV